MFAGDDKSSSSSCHSSDLKRSHSQLEEDSVIPEGNENALLGDEMLTALLSSILREKRQALMRSPQVSDILQKREQNSLRFQHQAGASRPLSASQVTNDSSPSASQQGFHSNLQPQQMHFTNLNTLQSSTRHQGNR